MVSDPHFIGRSQPPIDFVSSPGSIYSSTQHITRTFIAYLCSCEFLFLASFQHRVWKAKSMGFVLEIACFHSLVNHCIKVIRILKAIYSFDNFVDNCNLASHWYPSGYTFQQFKSSRRCCNINMNIQSSWLVKNEWIKVKKQPNQYKDCKTILSWCFLSRTFHLWQYVLFHLCQYVTQNILLMLTQEPSVPMFVVFDNIWLIRSENY